MKLSIYYSESTDPSFNQAIEESLLKHADDNHIIAFLWQNQRSVNIGKDQNPWRVCKPKQLKQDNINIVRRHTIGGAVYQDLTHTNIALIGSNNYLTKDIIQKILLGTFDPLNIEVTISDQLECLIDNKKVSNTALSENNHYLFFHSTIRVNTSLTDISQYMNSRYSILNHKDLERAYTSINQHTRPLEHNELCQYISDSIQEALKLDAENTIILNNQHPDWVEFSANFYRLKSWDWNYGQSPSFIESLQTAFSWGNVELRLNIDAGVINNVYFDAPVAYHNMMNDFSQTAIGYPFNAKSMISIVCGLLLKHSEHYDELMEVSEWLQQEIA
ncbi:lipoyl protein ligase domain-containing protein [Photobacterium leiognathi]|uniref:lipoyl protein ligase domain-containing protein n=1 Tax=Photobacterium leiognathi TaxID=553611 RepID=UPI002982B339|nr:lipoate protein ligase C-terminal domain-containing protein [Photobacterium leiognathi]